MMFVHGTGVRRSSYDQRLADVSAGVATIRPSWKVASCYWGDEHGARLNANGVTIPTVSARGLAKAEEDQKMPLWWALELDPLFELRLIRPSADVLTPFVPRSGESASDWIVEVSRALPRVPHLADLIAEAGLLPTFANAIEAVLADEASQDALLCAEELGEELAEPLARAFIAQSIADADADGLPPLDGDTRDELVRVVVDALGASTRGIGGDVGKFVANLAMRAGGSRYVDRKRMTWSTAASPVAGDVLLYLARGGGIKEFIGARISEIDGPVVLLAHSLGGIAALELLVSRSFPQVEQLITVGSQGPLLYELDALPMLAFGQPLPASVPSWVNIFDPRDLLAYCGSGVFPGRVEDRSIDNRTPFPSAHSAYFFRKNKRFYGVLDEVLQ